ncbi:hypothetical protein BOP99_03040 [Campylobacter coli]|nr:hypothetical protein BOP99_03040 [Campylobacter coli]
MQAIFSHAKLTHLVTIIPENYINIDNELNTIYQNDIKKLNRIKKATGLQYRHIVEDGTTVSDLGEYAATMLLNDFKIDKNSLDAIVVCTQTPEFFIPATACYLHGRLNLKQETLAFDINQSCTGYIYGLYTLFSMIESGCCKRILFICSNTTSKLEECFTQETKLRGDGACASLLEYSEYKTESYFDLKTDGAGVKYLVTPFGAFGNPTKEKLNDPALWTQKRHDKQIYMNGLKVFNFSTTKEPLAFNELLRFANFKQENLDFVFFHQANKGIVSTITRRLNLDEKIVPNNIIEKYGNLSMTSIPAVICDTLNTYEKPLNKNLKIILGAFGAGFSWANALITLDTNFKCKKVQFYKKDTQ